MRIFLLRTETMNPHLYYPHHRHCDAREQQHHRRGGWWWGQEKIGEEIEKRSKRETACKENSRFFHRQLHAILEERRIGREDYPDRVHPRQRSHDVNDCKIAPAEYLHSAGATACRLASHKR